jgi:hypothetical protein
MAITMYDLAGVEADRRFSPFCWRARMALAHKGLDVETVPWRFTEKDKLPAPNDGRVPVIVDGDHDRARFFGDRRLSRRALRRPADPVSRRRGARPHEIRAELDRDGVAGRADPPRAARHL